MKCKQTFIERTELTKEFSSECSSFTLLCTISCKAHPGFGIRER